MKRLTLFFLSKRYQETFGTEAFEGVLVTAPDRVRAQQLSGWIGSELTHQAELSEAFKITTQTAASDPQWLSTHI